METNQSREIEDLEVWDWRMERYWIGFVDDAVVVDVDVG